MAKGKKGIRGWTWVLFIFFIIGNLILIGAGWYLGTLQALLTNWSFYVSNILIILSLIGLFMYKKWGFYVLTIYLIYLLIERTIISFDIRTLIIYLVIYGYLIWYRGFYKNRSYFD